jgi:hypothetical protein
MTAIEDIRKEVVVLIKCVTKEFKHHDSQFFISHHSPATNKSLSFPIIASGAYLRAIRILRGKSQKAGRLISDKELKRLLIDFIMEIKYGDEKKELASIDKHIVELFNKVKTLPLEKHLFIIPIKKLSLDQDVAVGKCKLVSLTRDRLVSLMHEHDIEMPMHTNVSEIVTEMNERNNTNAYIVVPVEAFDHDKALELAISKADMCLNVLRLYNRTAPFVLLDEFQEDIPVFIPVLHLDKRSYGEASHRAHLTMGIDFNKKMEETMDKGGLQTINLLMSKDSDELTTLEEGVLGAIFWFGTAVKDSHKPIQFIKSIAALEILLVPDLGRGKSNIMSKRFVSIMYAQSPNHVKKDIFRNMRSLYSVRNSILHGGEVYINSDDLNQIMCWTQFTIQHLLQYLQYNSVQELIEKKFPIDESLYSSELSFYHRFKMFLSSLLKRSLAR